MRCIPRDWSALRLRALITAIAAAWAFLALPALYAQNPRPTDYDVKAAYLYNFGRFVDWPGKAEATQGTSFTVCIIGQDPFGPSLDATLAGETIGGKTIVAKRISGAEESTVARFFLTAATQAGLTRSFGSSTEGYFDRSECRSSPSVAA